MVTLQVEGGEQGHPLHVPCQFSPLVASPTPVAFSLVLRSGHWCTAGTYVTLVGSVFLVPFLYLMHGARPSSSLPSPGSLRAEATGSSWRTEESPGFGSGIGLWKPGL